LSQSIKTVSKVTHSGIFDKSEASSPLPSLASQSGQPYILSMFQFRSPVAVSTFKNGFLPALICGLLLIPHSVYAHGDSVNQTGSVKTSISDLPTPTLSPNKQSVCPETPYGSNTINITLDMPEPKINNRKSRYDLRDFNVSTQSPYGKDGFTHVNGLMRGPMELSTKLNIAWQTNPELQENCFWYQSIDLTLRLRPVIYVASEIKRDRCYYNAIIEHEMKHVEVDRGLVRDYQNIIYDTIDNYVRQHGLVDQVPTGQEKEAQTQLAIALETELGKLHNRMHEERIIRQAQIDNVREYERVYEQCDLSEKLDN
jgi:hypothetical protein